MPDEELNAETCDVRYKCWYKDLRKPIFDLLPGSAPYIDLTYCVEVICYCPPANYGPNHETVYKTDHIHQRDNPAS